MSCPPLHTPPYGYLGLGLVKGRWETFYITHLLPYYNILKQGYSSLGYKHTEATKQLLSELAKNKVHSDKTKYLISKALVGDNNPFYNKSQSSYGLNAKLRMIEANSAYPVYIYNSFKNLLIIFPSVKTLAKLINSNHATLPLRTVMLKAGQLVTLKTKLYLEVNGILVIYRFISLMYL